MKNLIFFLLFSQIIISQTILDYGAASYSSIEEALEDKESITEAATEMLTETGSVVFPSVGYFYIDETILMYGLRDNVTSLGQGNQGVHLVTDKPISMFLVMNHNQEVRGFTAYYIGGLIRKECAVVRIGGDERNIGTEYISNTGRHIEHFRPGRTNAIGIKLDFDFEGDKFYAKYYSNGSNINEQFIENYGAYAVWVDFDNDFENINSHFHMSEIRGFWRYVNTGLKIESRAGSGQSMNGLDMSVHIWGARQFMYSRGLGFSRIQIKGQEQAMLNPDLDLPRLFDIKGSEIQSDIFVYDVGGKRSGILDVAMPYRSGGLRMFGWARTKLYWVNGQPKMVNTQIVNERINNDPRNTDRE